MAGSPATASPPLGAPGTYHGPGHSTSRLSPLPSRCPSLAAAFSPAVSSVSASAALKLRHRGAGVRCWATAEARGRVPLKVMISGAPASGKGTQCRMIVEKYGLVHVSTGDLLRAEVSSGTEIGKEAKDYMDNGKLVPDQVVTDMVVSRLSQPDVQERGWLLDGYPRSFSQAQNLESLKIRPDIFIVLEVPDDILIDRCVGRRLDPVTGKIYHVKNFPPENEEVSSRLITRSDDTFEKVKSRLDTYKQNSEAILPTYSDLLHQINGNRPVEVVFQEIDSLLQKICENTSVIKLTKTNASGLKTNVQKSGVYPIRCSEEEIKLIQNRLPCEISEFPWWKADLMNHAGHAIQVQHVLTAVLIYLAMAFYLGLSRLLIKSEKGFYGVAERKQKVDIAC